jgi:hypothetical protein
MINTTDEYRDYKFSDNWTQLWQAIIVTNTALNNKNMRTQKRTGPDADTKMDWTSADAIPLSHLS